MQPKLDWEFWLDSNISPIIAKWLNNETIYIFKSSYVLNLNGLEDLAIFQLSRENQMKVIIISKDSGFAQIINRYGSPPKLINLKIGNTDNKVLFRFLIDNLEYSIEQLIVNTENIVELK